MEARSSIDLPRICIHPSTWLSIFPARGGSARRGSRAERAAARLPGVRVWRGVCMARAWCVHGVWRGACVAWRVHGVCMARAWRVRGVRRGVCVACARRTVDMVRVCIGLLYDRRNAPLTTG